MCLSKIPRISAKRGCLLVRRRLPWRRTANGEIFDMTSITAAHPTLPIPSYARVTNTRNGRSIIVRINDRGPFHGSRVIDLSVRTAKLLEFHDNGVARVRVEYVGTAPLEGSDDRQLVATLRTGTPAPAPSGIMLASAKPFIPEVPSSSRGAVRCEVPTPTGRPIRSDTPSRTPAQFPPPRKCPLADAEFQAAQINQPARPANDRFNLPIRPRRATTPTPRWAPRSLFRPMRPPHAATTRGWPPDAACTDPLRR